MSEINSIDEEQADVLLEIILEQRTVKSSKLLTKSKFLNGMQCPKLLWTRCNAPEVLPEISSRVQSIFDIGHRVGELAIQRIPGGNKVQENDFLKNLEETQSLLLNKNPKPIYEAGSKNWMRSLNLMNGIF